MTKIKHHHIFFHQMPGYRYCNHSAGMTIGTLTRYGHNEMNIAEQMYNRLVSHSQ